MIGLFRSSMWTVPSCRDECSVNWVPISVSGYQAHVVLRIAARAVNADEGAAVLEPGLERLTLRLGVRVAAGVVPHRDLEALQLLGVHDRGILGDIGRPAAFLRDRHQGRIGRLDRRIVAIAVGFRENQQAAALQVLGQFRRRAVHDRRDEARPAAPAARRLLRPARRRVRDRLSAAGRSRRLPVERLANRQAQRYRPERQHPLHLLLLHASPQA